MTAVLPPRTVLYQPDAVRHWLQTLHGGSTGLVWIGSDIDQFKGRTYPTGNPRWADLAARHIDQLDAAVSRGIYCRTTTLTKAPWKGRGGDDDSLSLPGLAADLDIAGPGHRHTPCNGGTACTHLTDTGLRRHATRVLPLAPDAHTARTIIDESGLPDPSIWIHSGGGLYAWWLLDQPWHIDDLPRAKRLCARWQDPIAYAAEQLGYTYGRLGDLARILRIPGTVNRKTAMPEPAPCRILQDTGRRYTLENLRGALTDAVTALPKPEPIPLKPRRVAPTGGDLTPWDDYEARTDWADILTPHGWTLHHTHGRIRYWTRPGKDRRDGFSASTGRNTDRDRLYVFTDATAFDPMTPYSKPAAFALLHCGGNFPAAGRELRRLGYGAPRQEVA